MADENQEIISPSSSEPGNKPENERPSLQARLSLRMESWGDKLNEFWRSDIVQHTPVYSPQGLADSYARAGKYVLFNPPAYVAEMAVRSLARKLKPKSTSAQSETSK